MKVSKKTKLHRDVLADSNVLTNWKPSLEVSSDDIFPIRPINGNFIEEETATDTASLKSGKTAGAGNALSEYINTYSIYVKLFNIILILWIIARKGLLSLTFLKRYQSRSCICT